MGTTVARVTAAVFAACACGGAAAVPGPAQAADHPVSFPAGPLPAQYAPAAIEAGPGDTVTFGGAFASHPLVWNTGDFPTRSSGATATFAFARGGTFRFHCMLHPGSMFGTVHVAGDQLATPDFTWAPAAPQAGQAVTFSASAFADPDGSIAAYQWDLDGDGIFESAGAQVTRTYPSGGTVPVALRYVDDGHETSVATAHAVAVAGAPGGGGAPAPGGGSTPGAGGAPSGGGAPGGGATPGGGAAPGGASGTPSSPGGGGGAGSGTTEPGSVTTEVRVSTRSLAFRKGGATVTLRVRTPAKVRVALRQGSATLATGTATVRPGAGRVHVKLTRAGARRLRRAHKLRATLVVALRNATATPPVKQTVSVRLAG
jgi:plastocyanin